MDFLQQRYKNLHVDVLSLASVNRINARETMPDSLFDLNRLSVIKQLLDEVEHDIMNYQNRGLCYLPKPKTETDNTDTRFDNS